MAKLSFIIGDYLTDDFDTTTLSYFDALVFAAGIYLPPQMVAWFQNVAKLLG